MSSSPTSNDPQEGESEGKSTEEKQAEAEELQRLSAVTVFETIRREGE
jgi:hypothetical protein